MKNKLIGISGKARAGKDTIANYMWAELGYTRIAFADPLKRAAKEIFGLSDAQMIDDDLKEMLIGYWGLSPRQIFQRLGTEAIRNTFGADTWVKRFFLSYDLLKDTDDIVVPDVRFDEEAAIIRENGGVIIEVRRGEGLRGETGKHASESGLSLPPEFIVENNSTMEALYAEIDLILGNLQQ